MSSSAQNYVLKIDIADSSKPVQLPVLQQAFQGKEDCIKYIEQIPLLLQSKGFLGASVDKVLMDSIQARIRLFAGKQYEWGKLQVRQEDIPLLQAAGWREKQFADRELNYFGFKDLQEKLIRQLENSGYPFAAVLLDSVQLEDNRFNAVLQINRGPLYRIDSIRIFGDARISNVFLQRYLEIPNGSPYQKKKLLEVDGKLLQLPYLRPQQTSDLSYLGSGALLNVYVKSKKCSEVNGLLGFLPTTDARGAGRLQISGDFNLQLKNSFGKGETVGMIFQQLQPQSPRLRMQFRQPFLWGSPWGAVAGFEGYKRDSSFINIQYQVGAQYALGGNRNGKIFFQQFITSLDYIDTLTLISTKRLPEQIDQTTTGLGLDYEWWNTDYRMNPRKGFDIRLQTIAGIRRIRKNNKITGITKTGVPPFDFNRLYDSVPQRAYSFRIHAVLAKYFRVGRQAAFKIALNGGWIESPNLFRNELFQLGGFQLLRGFDDERFFASAYAVFTAEYRVLTGQNSYLYFFTDGAKLENRVPGMQTRGWFGGTGLGLTTETKAGLFNVALALGKEEGLPVNPRQMKIHFGYFNFF
ncbi:MAG: BamA/TamA family outer membrane protein [Bacteroidetes bacterium]|nr:BamA/TamA family outer membrane protein [Bacteroidota bacterium]